MAVMSPEEHAQAIFLLGPWLVGSFLDILLQGILACQFVHYWSWYHDDKVGLRVAVIVLAFLTTLKSIQAFTLVWIMFIDNFTDVTGAVMLNYTAWWQSFNSLFVAIIGLYVQSYFCYRLAVISRSIYIVIPIAVIFVFAFLSMILACYYITKENGDAIGNWFAAHLSSVFAGDVLLSFTTAFFLMRSKKNVLSQTVSLISALIRLTFQTAAPAALCAMFNLIFSQIYNGEEKLISTAFNQMIPKLYAVSMMWTLNARRNIRAVHTSRGEGSSNDQSYNRPNRTNVRRGVDNLELGTINGIQVRAVQETVRHIDFEGDADVKVHHDSDSGIQKVDDYSMRKQAV